MQVIRVCSKSNNLYIFSLYRNPDLDDSIYDCLLSFMSDIQELNRKSSFIFVGDLNAHHPEWLKSMWLTHYHGIEAFDFTNLSDCTQLIKVPTHKLGNCLDLLLSDVAGVVDHLFDALFGNSDHSSISFSVILKFPILHFLRRCIWSHVLIGLVLVMISVISIGNPVSDLNKVIPFLIERRVPSKVIRPKVNDEVWFNSIPY